MKQLEFLHIISAILILTVAAGFSLIVKSELEKLAQVFLFSIIIIIISVLAKKIISYSLDADVEHEIWQMQNFGLTKNFQTKKPIPIGAIFPLLLSVLSLGIIKFSAILTYETRALKYRASKRFGPFSYTEMTDRHNAIIGASSTVALLILSIIAYLLPGTNLEYLAKLSHDLHYLPDSRYSELTKKITETASLLFGLLTAVEEDMEFDNSVLSEKDINR